MEKNGRIEPIQAARRRTALTDRSHWGRLRVSGRDRRKFLHNMTTADFNNLANGAGLDAVFVTSTARIIDYVTAYAQEEAILVVTSPERREIIPNWLRRFIFFTDEVTVEDISGETVMFSLYGPESAPLLAATGVEVANLEPHEWCAATIGGVETMVAAGGGLSLEGYTLIAPKDGGWAVWETLMEAGVPHGLAILDRDDWERLALQEGRPRADRELTEDHNPLEAGLWHAVSFNKGCFIGQEVIARLDTYQKVKQRLMGIRLEGPVEAGAEVQVDGRQVGVVTRAGETESGYFGLGYIRTKAAEPGSSVEVDGTRGELVEPAHLTWVRTDLPAAR